MDNHTNSKAIQDRIAVYQASLKEWDAKLDQFDAKLRIEYENERDGFTRDMAEAWKDLTEAKLDEYSAQIEGSYQKLKAKWHENFAGNDSTKS
jgi:hypothetical protein